MSKEDISDDIERPSDPEIEAAWKVEIARRIKEIQSRKVQGLSGEEVSARVRKIVGRGSLTPFLRNPD
jgi:putative addiction module component (TIGR02574 family)